ncbi:hypothetical protein [Streptomyces catenulae]|uniref:Uncharacterized protein n=1 Tax=Streptomyces catenulae TaxID=66875 RepID=A0ABV2Z255_9ACTN|nr:hypothetical protein [Streptomyces catenulae]
MTEIDTLLDRVVPAVEAAVGVHGAGARPRTEDPAADATVRRGPRPHSGIISTGGHSTPILFR